MSTSVGSIRRDEARGPAAIAMAASMLDPATRRRWFALVPLSLLAAGAEAFGAALILALLRAVQEPERDNPLLGALGGRLGPFALAVVGFYLAKSAVVLASVSYANRVACRSVVEVSERLLARYLAAPPSFFERCGTSELIRNTNGAVDVVLRGMLVPAAQVLGEGLVVLGLFAYLVAVVPGPALLAALGLLVVVFGALSLTQRRFARFGAAIHALNGELLERLRRAFDARREILVLGKEPYFRAEFARRRADLSEILWRRATLEAAPRLLIESIFVAAVALLLCLLDGPEPVSFLGLFAYAGFRILPSMHRITSYANAIRAAAPAAFEIHEHWCALAPPAERTSTRAPPFEKIEVEIREHRHGGAVILSDLRFEIPRGAVLAVAGPSGSGKSTLFDLLLGLERPSDGAIRVDGEEADPEAHRRRFGYVPQEPLLLDESLRRNVALGVEDQAIDDARVREALRLARLEAFVARLPEGLDTRVGERGARMSGGERQRVAIARALYADPQLLLLDEPSSALDEATEAELIATLRGLGGEKTVLFATHSPGLLAAADRVVRLGPPN